MSRAVPCTTQQQEIVKELKFSQRVKESIMLQYEIWGVDTQSKYINSSLYLELSLIL